MNTLRIHKKLKSLYRIYSEQYPELSSYREYWVNNTLCLKKVKVFAANMQQLYDKLQPLSDHIFVRPRSLGIRDKKWI